MFITKHPNILKINILMYYQNSKIMPHDIHIIYTDYKTIISIHQIPILHKILHETIFLSLFKTCNFFIIWKVVLVSFKILELYIMCLLTQSTYICLRISYTNHSWFIFKNLEILKIKIKNTLNVIFLVNYQFWI